MTSLEFGGVASIVSSSCPAAFSMLSLSSWVSSNGVSPLAFLAMASLTWKPISDEGRELRAQRLV